jgi:Domain of unknown function (DUF397)
MEKIILSDRTGGRRGTGWLRSSASIPGNQCVEVRFDRGTTVHLRDSKGRREAELQFERNCWIAFMAYCQQA